MDARRLAYLLRAGMESPPNRYLADDSYRIT